MEYLISLGLGAVVSFLQGQKGKTLGRGWRFAIAFIASFAVAVSVNAYSIFVKGGTFDFNELLASLGAAFVASQGFYNLYFKGKI